MRNCNVMHQLFSMGLQTKMPFSDGEDSVTTEEAELTGSLFGSNTLKLLLSTLDHSYTADADYCEAFVRLFRQVFLRSDHGHFNNWYAIVPSLCLNFLEASILAEEMLHKKNNTRDAYFTDDGFVIGVAFILAVLEQNRQFDAMSFFKVLREEISNEEVELARRKQSRETESKLQTKSPRIFHRASTDSVEDYARKNVVLEEEEDDEMALKAQERKVLARKRKAEILRISLATAESLFG